MHLGRDISYECFYCVSQPAINQVLNAVTDGVLKRNV